MRIFERLRGRERSIERKLLETIAADLLHRIDDEGPVMVPDAKSECRSASDKAHQ